MSTGEMTVMDHTGDTKTIWNTDNPEEVAAAEAQFDELREKGYLAYKVRDSGTKGVAMSEFDAEAGKMILAPMPRGG